MHNGYAVIDLETTGLSPKYGHRVIEIGIVHVSPTGRIEQSFETLVHPSRDLGPTHIHQIRGKDVTDAPSFRDIAGSLVELLRGRVLVAHNARFEVDFLTAEFERLGCAMPVGIEEALCTMRLAATFLPGSGRKLADCCAAFDIELTNAHEALADATATAFLLGAYIEASRADAAWWTARGEASAGLHWPLVPSTGARWLARHREGTMSQTSLLDRATDRLPARFTDDASRQYAAMLDEALADGLLSVNETDALADLARRYDLDEVIRTRLHGQYFDDLVAAVWADAVLTARERAEIETVATLLDIDRAALRAALADRAPSAPGASRTPGSARSAEILLDSSSVVVLTGEMVRSRDAIEADLARLGITAARAVTKKTTLVVAADVDSLSGKARKAKQYGIPIGSEQELEAALMQARTSV